MKQHQLATSPPEPDEASSPDPQEFFDALWLLALRARGRKIELSRDHSQHLGYALRWLATTDALSPDVDHDRERPPRSRGPNGGRAPFGTLRYARSGIVAPRQVTSPKDAGTSALPAPEEGPAGPPPVRRREFDDQLTRPLMKLVMKQTKQLVRWVQRTTPWRDHLGAEDRLHTAIVKTLDGSRLWDPDRIDLGRHLFGIIASDLDQELRHSDRFPHASLEDDDTQDLDALRREVELAVSRSDIASREIPLTAPVWSIALVALRAISEEEPHVLAILRAYGRGAFARDDVMRVAKLSRRAYDVAFAQLLDFAQLIDEDLNDLITQTIA